MTLHKVLGRYLPSALLALGLWVSASSAQGTVHQEEEFKVIFPLGKTYDYSRIRVTRVIDGDTLQLESGERVCLIGVDAPEVRDSAKAKRDSRAAGRPVRMIKARGQQSAKFVADLVLDKQVRLEFDVQQKDPYGRLLAYVYIGDVFLNAEIIKAGHADWVSSPPNVKQDGLLKQLAREEQGRASGAQVESPAAEETPLAETRESCQARGGIWGEPGEMLQGRCDRPAGDAGRGCRDSSECEGVCIAELTVEQEERAARGEVFEMNGRCSPRTVVLGCWPVVEDGRVNGLLCMD